MNYYAFISGLPDLIFDEHKKVHSTREFRDELNTLLARSDKKVVKNLFLKYDNNNLLSFLIKGEENMSFNEMANYTLEEILDMVDVEKDEDRKWNKKYPTYLQTFIQDYLSHTETPKNILGRPPFIALLQLFITENQQSVLKRMVGIEYEYPKYPHFSFCT